MELNLIGTLAMLKAMDMVPSFSELARAFGKDRHTIKAMYEGKETAPRKKKPSELDRHEKEIAELLSHPGVSVKAAYWFMRNERGIRCKYDNFKTFVRARRLLDEPRKATPHPFYETDPGKQLQVDWVESMKLTTVDGEVLEFNLFSATLGYSRFHYFEYTEFKQEADFRRCLIHAFQALGGLTEEVLTDNMSAIVSVSGGGKIRDRAHLIEIIKALNRDINRQRNTGTDMPPALLFAKEKEHLRPLPSKALLDSYVEGMRSCKVPSTFTIAYKGIKYSVPPYLISKTVSYEERGGVLRVYHKGELVAEHEIRAGGAASTTRSSTTRLGSPGSSPTARR